MLADTGVDPKLAIRSGGSGPWVDEIAAEDLRVARFLCVVGLLRDLCIFVLAVLQHENQSLW